tara:strand:+ start:4696 stop:5022 length:327 start_codon:yes stop_codon:yes gene_type:complete
MNDDDDDYIVSIDGFNNKGYKGDDDFETWMKHEAPFIDNSYGKATDDYSLTGTFGEGSSAYSYDTTITTSMSDTITFKTSHSIANKQKKLPIDILYKWYPKEMKEIDD